MSCERNEESIATLMNANLVRQVNIDRVPDFAHCSLDDTIFTKGLRFNHATALKIPFLRMIIETLVSILSFSTAVVSLVYRKTPVESVSLIIGFLKGN